MNQLILYFILICHILTICFVTLVPLFNCTHLLFLHLIFVPFLMAHWLTNNNTCVLTLIEMKLRQKMANGTVDENDCFTCRLINPIYDVTNHYSEFSTFIYLLCILLWCVTAVKVYHKFSSGQIQSFYDIFDVSPTRTRT